eukprot:11216729-Lingulodinium_polyedra.AAC.1
MHALPQPVAEGPALAVRGLLERPPPPPNWEGRALAREPSNAASLAAALGGAGQNGPSTRSSSQPPTAG